MSIYRDKRSPYWQFDFQRGGLRFSGSTGLKDKHHAQAFEDAEKQKADQLIARMAREARAPLTLKAACDRWWTTHGSRLSDRLIKSTLDRLVEILGAKTQLHAITDVDVAHLVETRSRDVRRDCTLDGKQLYRPITATTVNRTLDLLRRVMRRARDNWDVVLLREPTWKNHRLRETRRHVREISPREESALDQVEDIDFAELRRFAIITGLRRKDLLLTWPQVDFDLAVVRVTTKGGVPRVLPLTREAYAILWKRRGQHAEYVFTFKAQKTRPCPKTKRKMIKGQRYPITYFGIGSNKRKWKKAGVDARIHDLRHTTGMRTLRATGNLKAAQKILGHTDIAITAKFYTDATVEDMRAAMEATAPREIEAPKLLEQKKDSDK